MVGRTAFIVSATAVAAMIFCMSSAMPQTLTEPRVKIDDIIVLHGVLTRQGMDRRSFWAITDTEGRTWEIVEVSPKEKTEFRRLENLRIVARIQLVRIALRKQVRVVEIAADPSKY
jgi:hypothetical protein